ncbi:TolC family protein [Pendulispora albinea]|uniref:TolC family protein n=1 Tax=Pendulispora albinea TaxID=2741071 RepID=A0ABZ2MAH0_9BACT
MIRGVRFVAAFAVALAAASIAPTNPANAAEGVTVQLTERRVAELALANHPDVRAAHATARAADAEAQATGRSRIPELVLSARYTRLSSLPERYRSLDLGEGNVYVLPQILDGYGARAALVAPLTDPWLRMASAARAAGKAALAREFDAKAAEVRVALDARTAYLAWRRATLGRELAADALRVAHAEVEEHQRRVTAGTASKTSGLGLELAEKEAGLRLRAAEADVEVAAAELGVFLDVPSADAKFESAEVLEGELLAIGDGSPVPALAAAIAEAEAADERVDAEALAFLPRIAITGVADVSVPNPRVFAVTTKTPVTSWEITAQIEWSTAALSTGTAALARARADREAARARVEAVRRDLVASRRSAEASLRSARDRIVLARERLASARTLANARRAELQAGVTSPLDVVIAESELIRAGLAHADALVDARLARAKLDAALGRARPPAGPALAAADISAGGPPRAAAGIARRGSP